MSNYFDHLLLIKVQDHLYGIMTDEAAVSQVMQYSGTWHTEVHMAAMNKLHSSLQLSRSVSHAKFSLDWRKGVRKVAPQIQVFVKIAHFGGFLPHRAEKHTYNNQRQLWRKRVHSGYTFTCQIYC